MTPFALITGLLVSLAGLAFVCLVMAVFVILARFISRRLLGDDDGSSLL